MSYVELLGSRSGRAVRLSIWGPRLEVRGACRALNILLQFYSMETDLQLTSKETKSLFWRECTPVMQFPWWKLITLEECSCNLFFRVCKPKLLWVRSFESVCMCVRVFVNIWTTCVYGFINKAGLGHVLWDGLPLALLLAHWDRDTGGCPCVWGWFPHWFTHHFHVRGCA